MTAPCPFCGSERRASGVLPPDRLAPEGQAIALVRCTGCGTLETVPSDDPVIPVQADLKYLPHEHPTGLKGWLTRKSQRRKVSLTLPWSADGTVVDLGCGSGGFLEAWLGFRPEAIAIGLETAPEALERSRRRGVEVVEGELGGGLPDPLHGAALYTLWHVLEHLDDPAAALKSIVKVIAPSGRIVVAVPNAAGFERSLFGDRTIAWDVPRHRWHFTPEGLSALARITGLRVLDRFNLFSDDVYDAVGSLQGILYPDSWVRTGDLRSTLATGLALMGGVPTGMLLAALNPWRLRASLGVILAPER